jgi:hypothetical protein
MSGANTSRPSKHLLEKHRISGEKEAEIAEEDSESAQAVPIVDRRSEQSKRGIKLQAVRARASLGSG